MNESDTRTTKKLRKQEEENTELGPMQYTKIRIDINAGSPLSTTTKTAIRKASFILFVGHIVGVCECASVCVERGRARGRKSGEGRFFLHNFSDKKTFVVLIDSKEH